MGIWILFGVWGSPVGSGVVPLGSGFHLGSGGVLWGLKGSNWNLGSIWGLGVSYGVGGGGSCGV